MKEIILSQGKVALVDDEDFEYLNQFKWSCSKYRNTYYAVRRICIDSKVTTIKMHREILRSPKGKDIDHKDLDGLNNQKSNLRICSRSENIMNSRKRKNNTSGFKGVFYEKQVKKWRSQITLNGKQIHLGLYKRPKEASVAYEKAAKELFGEYYNQNP